MMDQWEYMQFEADKNSNCYYNHLLKDINRAGLEGWELVSTLTDESMITCIMKRKVPPPV